MIDFFQNCIDGVMIGAAYGLLAIGFTIVFGIMRRLNLSYGPSIMLGAFAGTWAFVTLNAAPWQVASITIAGTILIGIYVERLCFWAVRREVAIASMVSSFAIWMQLEEVAMLLLPGRTYPFPEMFVTGGFDVGVFFFRAEHLVILVVTVGIVLALRFLLYRTTYGLALRAVSEGEHHGGLRE